MRVAKAHLWVVLSNWLSRVISIIIQIITIPLLTDKLGQEGFAVYALICSLAAWYGLTDMGLGKSLQNFIGECQAKQERFSPYVGAVAVLLLFGLVFFSFFLWFGADLIAGFLLSGFGFIDSKQAKYLIIVSGILFFGYMLGLVTIQAFYAVGKGVYANLLSIICNCMFFVFLHETNTNDSFNRLLSCVIAYIGPLCLTGTLAYLFLIFRYASFERQKINGILAVLWRRSYRFSLLSFLSILILNADYIIMTQTLNSNDIAEYNLLYRIFWVGMSFYQGMLSAVWPLLTQWAVNKEWSRFLRAIFGHIGLGILGVIIMSSALWYFLPTILQLIAPTFAVSIKAITVILFGAYISLRIWCDTFSTALQAMSSLSSLLLWLPLQALISIGAQYAFSSRYGMEGILYGLICSFLLTMAWVLPIKIFRETKK
jgi:O-antigen/teichoic acid export membrane protein